MGEKHFLLSGKVVIRDEDDRCLLLKRSMSSKGNAGKWDLPGGKLEKGENFDEGLLREVAEETSLVIDLEHVAGIAESEMSTKKIVYLILEGRIKSGKVQLSSEHDDYMWIERHKLPMVELCEQFRPFAQKYSMKK